MIQYDPHRWVDHFFDIKGSLVKEIGVRVGVCVFWTVAIVWAYKKGYPVAISSTLHSLVGVALGLLLVFRTNASYDRFWEGRKLWGGIVNESRNLIRGASVHLAQHPRLLENLTRWTALFSWTAAASLRGEPVPGPVARELAPDDLAAVRNAQHAPLYVARRMTAMLVEARNRRLVSDIIYTSLDQNIQQLMDYLGGCERIRKTPLPFAYVVHLRRALVLYCFTLPFALVDSFGWLTVADVFVVAYIYFGIEEIGVEIEGPFGNDENDLPMDEMCETIHRNLYALSGMSTPPREALPEG